MGVTALDSGVLIGFLDSRDAFHAASVPALSESLSSGEVHLPAVAYTEVSIAVLRAGATQQWFDDLLQRLGVRTGTITSEVAAMAAALRANALADRRRRQWRLPDALVVADAISTGAERIITTDRRWPRLPTGTHLDVLSPSPRPVTRTL